MSKLLKGGKFFSKKYALNLLPPYLEDKIKHYRWSFNDFPLEKMVYDNIFNLSHTILPSKLEELSKLDLFGFHATTEENAMEILLSELKPIKERSQRIWSLNLEDSEDFNNWKDKYNSKQIETINKARKEGIFFFNSFLNAIEQAFINVEKLQNGNPAIILLELLDLKEIYIDPEAECKKDGSLISYKEAKHKEFPFVTFGKINVIGICFLTKSSLKRHKMPCDIGSIISFLGNRANSILKDRPIKELYEELTLFPIGFEEGENSFYLLDFWNCKCKENKILKENNIIS